MQTFSRILMVVSALACFLCFGFSLWAYTYAPDSLLLFAIIIFGLAGIWLTANVILMLRKRH
jgi:hypothetical protein